MITLICILYVPHECSNTAHTTTRYDCNMFAFQLSCLFVIPNIRVIGQALFMFDYCVDSLSYYLHAVTQANISVDEIRYRILLYHFLFFTYNFVEIL